MLLPQKTLLAQIAACEALAEKAYDAMYDRAIRRASTAISRIILRKRSAWRDAPDCPPRSSGWASGSSTARRSTAASFLSHSAQAA
jgi:hypothetical protein